MKLSKVKYGMYVTAGTGEDKDVGTVIDTNYESAVGREVLVRWASGVDTWVEASELRLSKISPAQFANGE